MELCCVYFFREFTTAQTQTVMSLQGTAATPLRSLNSENISAVTFISCTRRRVSIYWIDYQGNRVRYCVLNYSERFPITTYETHPWIFRDHDSDDVLVTSDGQQVYWPQPWDGGEQNYILIKTPGESFLSYIILLYSTWG